MTEYINLFSTIVHFEIVLLFVISCFSSGYLKERIKPSINSPLNWQMKPANTIQKLLAIYESLFIPIIVVLAILLAINFKWYFSVFFIIEAFVIPSIIVAVLERSLGSLGNFNLRKFLYLTRLITLILVDGIVYYTVLARL